MLTSGISGSRVLARVNRSSLCRARVRLGEEVPETVFRQVAGPLALPETPGAWWPGLRMPALDGTQFDVPDSVSNGDTFGGPSTGGTPFGFPQVRAAVLAEIGTHAILDAGLGGYRDGERRLAYPLWPARRGPGDLVIADRGFWSVEFVHAPADRSARALLKPCGRSWGPCSRSTSRPPVRARRRSEWAGPGCRPALLPPLHPDRPAQRAVSARHLQTLADQRLEGGRPGSAVPSAAAPVRPGPAPSDQEADAMADPEDSERPQQGRAGAMGAQPDHQTAQTPGRRQTRTSRSTALTALQLVPRAGWFRRMRPATVLDVRLAGSPNVGLVIGDQ